VKSWFLTGAAALVLAAPALAQEAPPSADMGGMNMTHAESPLGSYPMARDASGTSWQPDVSAESGLMQHADGWMLMEHALLNGVYDSQSGPRGGNKDFVAGMIMLMAQRPLDEGDTLQLRAMLSPEPVMGPSGYPLQLASGETADGKTPLIDRQHPHNLFMELSSSLSHAFGVHDSAFVYAGLPGEPALGPPAFMHRQSAMDDPAAPITHHWLDSTHITNGVVTAGWVHRDWKLEVSAFNGREPNQDRYEIGTPRLDSESARLSYNPDPHWSFQTSWGHLRSPEQLDPATNEDRWTASAIYTLPLGKDGWWSSTFAYGAKHLSVTGQTLDGWVAETSVKPNDPWTVFARAEGVRNPELSPVGAADAVGEVSIGAIHDWRAGPHVKIGLGVLRAFDMVPSALLAAYGENPSGAMAFVRLKLD
jgi:hypothetical protein